jgi:hypothetical protein
VTRHSHTRVTNSDSDLYGQAIRARTSGQAVSAFSNIRSDAQRPRARATMITTATGHANRSEEAIGCARRVRRLDLSTSRPGMVAILR